MPTYVVKPGNFHYARIRTETGALELRLLKAGETIELPADRAKAFRDKLSLVPGTDVKDGKAAPTETKPKPIYEVREATDGLWNVVEKVGDKEAIINTMPLVRMAADKLLASRTGVGEEQKITTKPPIQLARHEGEKRAQEPVVGAKK